MKVDFNQDFVEQQNLKFYLNQYQIGLDIDEVLADFIGGYKNLYKNSIHKHIINWYFSYEAVKNLTELKDNKEFWLGLEPKINNLELPFIPKCYISKRNFPVAWTEEWLEKNHFPCVPVIHVEDNKVDSFKEQGLDYFIDDSIMNFTRLNAAGCKTFLMDGPHNQQFDVGNYRISKLKDIFFKI